MMAPQIRPHTPYFTFPAVTGVMDHPSRDQKMAAPVVADERDRRPIVSDVLSLVPSLRPEAW
jgi:hypothetical protein